MKQIFLLTLVSITLSAHQPIVLHTKAKPQKEQHAPAAAQAVDDDDIDGQVVLANIANMLGCIGMLSTDPYNPAVAGPSIAQIGVSFINILTQVFKSNGLETELTRTQIENWFENLSNETKIELIDLLLRYAHTIRNQQYCPNCECDICRLHHHHEDCMHCR